MVPPEARGRPSLGFNRRIPMDVHTHADVLT